MGHARENGSVTIPRADRKRKMPDIMRNEAKNRYVERLLSFIAKIANKPPVNKSKKAKKTETVEVFSSDPNRKVIPKIIKKIPAINTNLAVNLRLFFKPIA